MSVWFTIPSHLIFLLCVLTVVIVGEGIIIFILLKKKLEKKYSNSRLANTVKWLEDFWGPFVMYVLATSIICIFIASIVEEDNITLSDMNNWVSIVLGLVALIVGIISLWLSFYNLGDAKKVNEEVQETLKKAKTKGCGWQQNEEGEWYYVSLNGDIVRNEWKRSGNNRYYLGPNGYVETDKLISKNNGQDVYYVDENGAMLTNSFKEFEGRKRYFSEQGKAIINGKKTIEDKTYCFKDGFVVEDVEETS